MDIALEHGESPACGEGFEALEYNLLAVLRLLIVVEHNDTGKHIDRFEFWLMLHNRADTKHGLFYIRWFVFIQ